MTTPHEGPEGYDDTPTPTPSPAVPPALPPVTSGWVTETVPAPPAAPVPEPAVESEPAVAPEPEPEPVVESVPGPVVTPDPVPEATEQSEPLEAAQTPVGDLPTSAPPQFVKQPAVQPADDLDSDPDSDLDSDPDSDLDSDPDGDPVGVPAAGTTRPRSRLVLAVLGALTALSVLGFAGVAVFTQAVASPVAERDDARDAALRTARDAARLLLAYDYRRLDEDFAAGAALTADPFKSEYERTTTRLVRDVATEYNAVVRAEVVQAGAVEVAKDRVVALLFVNQTTTSTRVQGAKVDLSRVRMVLQRIDGSWRVTGVDAL